MNQKHYEWTCAEERALARHVRPLDLPPEFKLPTYINRFDLLKAEGPRGVAAWLYETICKQNINYDLAEFNPRPGVSQLIRTPATILAERRATCLDLAVLFAAMCLDNDLLPVIVAAEGHAWAGISLTRTRREAEQKAAGALAWERGLLKDLAVLRDLAEREYLFVECTGAAQSQALAQLADKFPEGRGRESSGRMSFQRACAAGSEQLRQHTRLQNDPPRENQRLFLFALDIHSLQVKFGFEPETSSNATAAKEYINVSNTGSGAVAVGNSVAAGAGGIAIGGNVNGGINVVDTGGGNYVGGDMNEQKINTGGGAYIGGNINIGGDFVGGDKIERKINIGNITGSTGVAIGNGAQANVIQSGAGADEIARAFAVIGQRVAAMPDGPDKAVAKNALGALEVEARKGDRADEGTVRKWFNFLAQTAPDALEVALDTFVHPIKGISTVFRKIAEQAKAEKSGR